MRESRIKLPDSRTLAYTDIGETGWPTVFFFHGAPSSRLRLTYLEEQFLAQRVRVVSPDRPSYGGSSPQPGRSMADWADDAAALADALQISRFIVAGHSSGGPYALACAAVLPDRVEAAMTLGGVTDFGWDGAWDGYFPLESELMRISDEDAAVAWCEDRLGADGSKFMTASELAFPEPDEKLYEDTEVARLLSVSRAEAFRQGVRGYAQDIVVQGHAWPFDARSIRVPVHVLHGEADSLLPIAHAQHTTELLPHGRLEILPGHGHFTILAAIPGTAISLASGRP